jgi:streptomycin 3"-adenylyltransferase
MRWLGCPSDLKPRLTCYAAAVSDVLGERLVGIYVHGSAARGCYNPTTGDVDMIVVMRSPCPADRAEQLAALHGRSSPPLDATFATLHQLGHDEAPTPVEFVIKPSGQSKPRLWRGSHGYFLLDRQDAYECSITLTGVPFRDLARPVPWPVLAGCLKDLLPHILPKFKNPALMLCRIAYAFVHRESCSKREAGRWALTALDKRWHPLIEEALDRYAQGLPDDSGETAELRALEQQCREIITQTPGGSL